MQTKEIERKLINTSDKYELRFVNKINTPNRITNKQKYDLALIELVYNIKPFNYENAFNKASADRFISKHKDYIDKNIVVEKYYTNGGDYICDINQNFYGIIYEGGNDGKWNNKFYIKNELLDIKPNLAENLYYSIVASDVEKNLSLSEVLVELGRDDIRPHEEYYSYINKCVDKFKNKISLSEHIKNIDEKNCNSIPEYNPF